MEFDQPREAPDDQFRSLLEESKDSICVDMEFDMSRTKSSFVKVYAMTETQDSTMMSSGVASSNRTFTQSSLVQPAERRSTIQSKKKPVALNAFQIKERKFKSIIYSRSKQILSPKEKEVVWDFLKSSGQQLMTKPTSHRYSWLKCSGAYNAMLTNPGYYELLLANSVDYPSPSLQQIETDLRRTYTEEKDPEKLDQKIVPLRRVLVAYVQRCPTIGFCQGMSHLAARLLAVMPEEEAFWTFVQMLEVILPLDYYSNLLGVLVDLKVFKTIFEDRLPKLHQHLQHFQFDIDILMTRWLISLFVNHLPLDAELAVWDLFMIKGVNVLFRVAITLFQLMQEDILKCQDMCEIKMSIEEFAQKVNRDTLLKQLFVGIKNKEIEKLRASHKAEIMETLKEQLTESKSHILAKNPNMRLNFADRFSLYKGLVKYYSEHQSENPIATQVISQQMDRYERDLMKLWVCKSVWPVCLFDPTFGRKNPTYLSFRVNQNLAELICEDYFYGANSHLQQEQPMFKPGLIVSVDRSTRDEMLIERNTHLCQHEEYLFFTANFKIRYEARDPILFQNPAFQQFLEDDTQIPQFNHEFIKQIAAPLTTEVVQAAAEDNRNSYDKPVVVRGFQTYMTQVANDLMQQNEEYQDESCSSNHKSAAEEILAQTPMTQLEMAVQLGLICVDRDTKSLDHQSFRILLNKSEIEEADKLNQTMQIDQMTDRLNNSYSIAKAFERSHRTRSQASHLSDLTENGRESQESPCSVGPSSENDAGDSPSMQQ